MPMVVTVNTAAVPKSGSASSAQINANNSMGRMPPKETAQLLTPDQISCEENHRAQLGELRWLDVEERTNQRVLPLTSRPTPGTSTTTSKASAANSSTAP